MWRRCRVVLMVVLTVGGLVVADARMASAIGYYNLPGSFCQCFGYGNGAGHHACLVLGPSTCSGFCATKEVRLQCAPQPPYECYGGQCGPMDQGQFGPMDQGSWLLEPARTPSVNSQYLPAPAAVRTQVFR